MSHAPFTLALCEAPKAKPSLFSLWQARPPINPRAFQVEGPAVISFSGGLTSAYMLRRILDEGLQADVHVVFCDTGKEREETYTFVARVAQEWGVKLWYLSYGYGPSDERLFFPKGKTPFDLIIARRRYLPNPTTRFCTQELKINQIKHFMRFLGYRETVGKRSFDTWSNIVGLRADEPRRVAKIRDRDSWTVSVPLYEAGITKQEVTAFWETQPFTLGLKSYEGNCDLCYLKGQKKRLRILRDYPELGQWWQEKEGERLRPFRPHGADYGRLISWIERNPELYLEEEEAIEAEEDLRDCFCTE